jgi:hypothetical protein
LTILSNNLLDLAFEFLVESRLALRMALALMKTRTGGSSQPTTCYR